MKLSQRLTGLLMAGALVGSLSACDVLGDIPLTATTPGSDTPAASSDLEALTPTGETFFQNTEKGAGSKGKVLVTHLGDHPGGESRMYVVSDDEELQTVMGPDGNTFSAATETLGGNAYVPVFITTETLQSIRFDHKIKEGECNQYIATKDGDSYNAELQGTAACSH